MEIRSAGLRGHACPAAHTLEEGLNVPRLKASIDTGIFTVELATFVFEALDHNDDGTTCFLDVAALNGGNGH